MTIRSDFSSFRYFQGFKTTSQKQMSSENKYFLIKKDIFLKFDVKIFFLLNLIILIFYHIYRDIMTG